MKVAAKGISKINDTSSSTSTSSTKSNPKNISLNLNNNPNNLINPNINIKLNLNLSPILFSPSCLNSSIFSPGLDLFKTQSEGYFENVRETKINKNQQKINKKSTKNQQKIK